jgi:predicted short-subunit dehydrogenase-like oxidoreductase (DUF2520 family)
MREPERRATDVLAGSGRFVVIGRGRVGGAVVSAALAAKFEVSAVGHHQARLAAAGAGIVLLCVPDRAVSDVCADITRSDPLPVRLGHTSGASGLDVLEAARQRGVDTFSLHPLQTIPHAETDLAGAYCAVSGSSAAALAIARTLGLRLGMTPFEVREDRRAAYHAAAVIASNFLITLEEAAADLLARAGVTDARTVLAPLVLRAAANWTAAGGNALTGPIARGDQAIVRQHLAALRELAPDLLPLYDALAERTRAAVRKEPNESPSDGNEAAR